ncbi:MAG TPA: metal ABC transporter substrate-binding protein [Phycisphaerales bacterium]|nr:metal ABC transporter substrate-binding protein [Phycisphaerales bacterium]
MWKPLALLLAAALLALALTSPLTACKQTPPAKVPRTVKAVVTVAPLKSLVEPLLPPGSSVTILMQPGRSEHGYEFTPADVAALADANLVVYVGLGLEGQLESILAKQNAPNRELVCFAEAVGLKSDHDHAHDHDHKHDHHAHDDHDHDHAHDEVNQDPHLWLDPVVVEAFLPTLSASVLKASSTPGSSIESDLARVEAATTKLRTRVHEVHEAWKSRLEPYKGRAVVTHHNAFARPAARYGFKVAAVIREFDSDPTPADLAKVADAIRAHNVSTIFIEPQYSPAAANKIRDIAGVTVSTLDPLGDGDWFAMMQRNLDALAKGLESASPAPATPTTTGAK